MKIGDCGIQGRPNKSPPNQGIIAQVTSLPSLNRLIALLLLSMSATVISAQTHVASDLARQVLSATLDPTECYHVREIEIRQQDVTFYLTEGYLIFGKPVNGAPISAVFSSEVDGGDSEVVLLPPDRAERRTLSEFTASPNLDEHITRAVFFFTDAGARALAAQIRKDPSAEKSPEVGLLMADKWGLTVTTLTSNFQARIVLDLLTQGPSGAGFFDATLRGRTLGDFDIVHDARATEQIGAGRVSIHDGVPQWETWTRFTAKDQRGLPPPPPEQEILSYNIDASMDASLAMHCVTKMKIRATADSRDVLPFEVDSAMRIISARVDGVPAEIYQHDSLRSGLVQNSGNQLFLVLPPQPFAPQSIHEIEIVHEGKVVEQMASQIFSVRARGTWYPGRGSQFATYDATFHYPDSLNLVSAGMVKDDHVTDGVRTTHRVPEGRLRLLGFNLGKYTRHEAQKNGITLEVSANQAFEASLRPPPAAAIVVPDPAPASHGIRVPQLVSAPSLPVDPGDRIGIISTEALAAIEFFRARFGEPPLKHLEVSPVTGRFGQGFAGMVYLPTRMYLNPNDVPVRADARMDEDFSSQLLRVHEIAHQWWGNIVTTDSYHHEWLMESLANYSSLLFLESKLGPRAIERGLDVYRAELLRKGPDGATAESRGPVVDGRRLESSSIPGVTDAVLYGKGTWIIHMIRRKLGDSNFLKMLAELRRRYEWRTITTDDFRELCTEFLPPGSPDPKLTDFFDQWVNGTGMPTIKLTYSVTGRKLTGTITQSDAPDDFSVTIPVEIRSGTAKPIVKQVRTGSGPVKFAVDLPAPAAKATLDPGWSILRR